MARMPIIFPPSRPPVGSICADIVWHRVTRPGPRPSDFVHLRYSDRAPVATLQRFMVTTTAFAQQTAVEAHPERAGRYRAVIGDRWNAPVVPHGGIVTALGLRAMAAELGAPDQSL